MKRLIPTEIEQLRVIAIPEMAAIRQEIELRAQDPQRASTQGGTA
jgi:hypothetical protein